MQRIIPSLKVILICTAALFIFFQPVDAEEFINSLGIKMIKIPAGTYMIGENQTNEITITRPFWISAHEITNEQFEQFDPTYQRTGWGGLDNHPANYLSWWDATAFCEWLNGVETGSGLTYRLPHEYEWEWAAHGGKQLPYPNTDPAQGNPASDLRLEANYYGVGGPDVWEFLAPVGSLGPNGYGLFDMIGNVKEWCCNRSFNYPASDIHDPLNPQYLADVKTHMMRGNSCWTGEPDALTVYYRIQYGNNDMSPKVGFRIVAVGDYDPNTPPVIDADDPASPVTVTSGETKVFSVQASDPDQDPLGYTWKLDDVTVDATGAQYTYTAYDDAEIGQHLLTVEVSDGRGSTDSHAWEIEVVPASGQPVTVDSAVASKHDDAVELRSGYTKLTVSTQYFGLANTSGFRFTNVPIPRGAAILDARLSTFCYSGQSKPVVMRYWGEASGDATAFETGYDQLTGRLSTAQSVTETLPVWERRQYNDSVNIAGIVQEIVDLPGWNTGNSLAIFASSDSSRHRIIAASDYYNGRYAPRLLVHYVVSGNQPPPPADDPVIGLDPSSLSFDATAGGNDPAGRTVALTRTAGGLLNWMATSDCPWLKVSPNAGTTASETDLLAVDADVSGLSAGSYNGTITITDPDAANSPQTITVTLRVDESEQIDQPAMDLDPSFLSFTVAEGGGNTPGGTVILTNIGDGMLTWTASVDQSWLSISPASGTVSADPASLNIAVDSAGLPAGGYSGVVTISSPEAANSPKTIDVSLTVDPAGGGDSAVEAVLTVAEWNDDGWEKNSTYPDLDGAISVGLDLWSAHRFTNVSIPQNARIVSATITFFTYSDGGSRSLDIAFYGEDIGDAAPLEYTHEDISGRPKTFSSVFQPGVGIWSNGYWTSADLSTVVQEIVQNGNWTAGNALCILVQGTGGPRYTGAADNSLPARLTVTYIAPQ